jgi:3-deoxy-7-phosphoheptulonate synthase
VPKYDLVKNYKRPSDDFVIIGGPCSVESEWLIYKMAKIVKRFGATHLRGGVFRAGTYPGKNFGWVDIELIKFYSKVARENDLKNIIEVLDYSEESFDLIKDHCDVFQVGARSQQNYSLLRKLGQYDKPVFLKRNTGCTVDEWLGSSEHLLAGGVKELYLIERGSSTFHNDVRWTPCIHTIPSVKSICDIPVIIDASHGTGRSDLVESITLAGVAAGAGGVLIETHITPHLSMSDAEQAVSPKKFATIIKKINKIREVL